MGSLWMLAASFFFALMAAFTKRQTMTDRELDEVQAMIDRIRRGGTA